jgi:hypothetical protein
VRTYFENIRRLGAGPGGRPPAPPRHNAQHAAEASDADTEFERDAAGRRVPPARRLIPPSPGQEAAYGRAQETRHCSLHDAGHARDASRTSGAYPAQSPADDCGPVDHGAPEYGGAPAGRDRYRPADDDVLEYGGGEPGGAAYGGAGYGARPRPAWGRTAELLNYGRRSVYRRGLSPFGRKVAAVTAVGVVLIAALLTVLLRGGASWPASVATVKSEISQACQNPDVKSEPGQINFACGKSTQQILWVFALMTSGDNPDFADIKTGRVGLEPITPAQGGQVAASLNLHHPYDPANPVDSLEVAARAINDIIGGATLTTSNGSPLVQGGLESSAANCVRYTGSGALVSRAGFPALCARPVTSPAGQAALVTDVYRKWVVGASSRVAQDAGVLFENAQNPGDRRVQAILRHLPHAQLSA